MTPSENWTQEEAEALNKSCDHYRCQQRANAVLSSSLRAAKEEIETLKNGLMVAAIEKAEGTTGFKDCGHNSYWTGAFGTCMACRSENAESEADALRKEISTARVAPTYHEGHECCRKCVVENAELRKEVELLKKHIRGLEADVFVGGKIDSVEVSAVVEQQNNQIAELRAERDAWMKPNIKREHEFRELTDRLTEAHTLIGKERQHSAELRDSLKAAREALICARNEGRPADWTASTEYKVRTVLALTALPEPHKCFCGVSFGHKTATECAKAMQNAPEQPKPLKLKFFCNHGEVDCPKCAPPEQGKEVK